MRPFARQGARLATNSSRVRQASRPRTVTTERHFHTSYSVASDIRPPNGPTDNHTPFNEREAEHRRNGTAAAKSEQEIETEDRDARNDEDRPATKRSMRGRREPKVPKPPPVPDWFLKHNVKLLKDSPGIGRKEPRGEVIQCVDSETGHVLFELPYYLERALLSQADKEGQKGSLQKDFFDHQVKFEDTEKKAESSDFNPKLPEGADAWKINLWRWAFLEAETSARAAFSLPSATQRSYSILSNRVDISLECPDVCSHDQMDEFMDDLGRVVDADIVRLDANDFAELAGDFVDPGRDGPGTYSHLGYDLFQGYVAAQPFSPKQTPTPSPEERAEENEMDEDEEADDENGHDDNRGRNRPLDKIREALMGKFRFFEASPQELPNLIAVPGVGVARPSSPSHGRSSDRVFQESTQDDMRIAALLESLVDSPRHKHSPGTSTDPSTKLHERISDDLKGAGDFSTCEYRQTMRAYRENPGFWSLGVAQSILSYLGSEPTMPTIELVKSPASKGTLNSGSQRRTIIHVRELRDLVNSRLGEPIIQQLCKVVQKRRRAGEQIMVVGTTSQDSLGPIHFRGDATYMQDFPLRSITVPPLFSLSLTELQQLESDPTQIDNSNLERPAYRRIMEINLRHLKSMLRKLRPEDNIDLSTEQLNFPGMDYLTRKVLSVDAIQRLVLVAIGLTQTHARSEKVEPIHLVLASVVTARSIHAVKAWSSFRWERKVRGADGDMVNKSKDRLMSILENQKDLPKHLQSQLDRLKGRQSEKGESTEASSKQKARERIDRIKKTCNPHESRLLSGVVDAANMKTTFAEVHAQPETIDTLKDLTSLSLQRPEAFEYGVLASDRLTGLLLYGPPGTGKTLLAKAVAKQSNSTMLEVSGAQIYDKYVGEGEKMVRAVFSLAKKLSPCIVFIDEADALFGMRSSNGRNTHREIISELLRAWDGMEDHSVFVMVASNRPFDLDDAVLRRLPRRVLVDLPVAKDRESILGIHLKNESLDPAVSLNKLAEQTALYSGSDLKNLSVAAALACVREENELAAKNKDDEAFKLPEKRTLMPRHFDKALAEISASISEDMSSLAAVRKFDEQYGDRKGRRKKTNYGFGMQDGGIDESAARVRSRPPPP